ncbi:MAG: hypothetical protein J2P57_17660 [Acidimicrobiaceae bacterium]|nr:hypothetical protein [Acidimicrobiaceae bacterium]
MNLGDLVMVIDPRSPRRGTWGKFVYATRSGAVGVSFPDGVEELGPFQVEGDPRLAAAAFASLGLEAGDRPLTAVEV